MIFLYPVDLTRLLHKFIGEKKKFLQVSFMFIISYCRREECKKLLIFDMIFYQINAIFNIIINFFFLQNYDFQGWASND